MTTAIPMLCLATLVALSACGHHPPAQPATTVRTIQISDVVEPEVLYAMPGEEIRWENLRTNPVRVGFLSTNLLEELGCREGVTTVFGQVNDIVTIPAGGSISLCFVRGGTLQYNVWFDEEYPKGRMSPTATVYIEVAG